MKRTLFAGAVVAALAACTAAQITTALSSAPGQLFCTIQMSGGGSFIAALTATAATGAAPAAGPLIVIATNAGKAAVDADCAKAAANIAGATSGVPVSPPANPATAANVTIMAPASPVVKPAS